MTENKPIRFLMIGGFLGAGKTTTISRLAQHYTQQGLNVGIVTNDQAYGLVDTESLRAQGFSVGEVPGACFCCKFDDLVSTVSELSEAQIPDLVIAEPVGSCTDLYATVIQPLRQLFGDRFELGPLIVLLKPEHGRKILDESSPRRGFSPDAEYIFLKQLEEADAIAINKIDKLTTEQRAQLLALLENRFPDVEAFAISAREGTGFEELLAMANSDVNEKKTMEVDYERYAIGEAELGWLNCQVAANADEPFWLDEVVLALTANIGRRLADAEMEVAHLKTLGQTLESSAVANLVSSSVEAELSLKSEIKCQSADLLVNARVAADPDLLKEVVEAAVFDLHAQSGVQLELGNVQSFRPGKPETDAPPDQLVQAGGAMDEKKHGCHRFIGALLSHLPSFGSIWQQIKLASQIQRLAFHLAPALSVAPGM